VYVKWKNTLPNRNAQHEVEMIQAHKLGEELRRLKKEDPERLQLILSQMSEEEAQALTYDEDVWLRPDQQVKDEWPEPIIMFMCGRG